MKDFISKKVIYIGLAAILVAVLAAVTMALTGGSAGFAAMLSEPFFKPVKSAMTSLVGSLEHIYGYLYRYDELETENAALKVRVAQLEQEYREYTEINEENSRLRSLLGFVERHEEMKLEPATLISWTASNFSSSFTASKGSSSGIELYDPVVDEYGYLVGQVTSVTDSTCVVSTVIDTTLSLGAQMSENGETGVAGGDFELLKQGDLKLSYIGDSTDVVIGSTVVTSGSGGVYPAGLVIGSVSGVAVSSSGLDPYAIVEPAADIENLVHIYVIRDFAVSE